MAHYWKPGNVKKKNKGWEFSRNNERSKKTFITQACILRTLDGVPIRKLFVGNLSPDVTDVKLMSVFKAFGTITDSKVIQGKTHPHGGSKLHSRLNIFGFVTFLKPEDAAAALGQKGRYGLVPKHWVVKAADSWHQPAIKPDGKKPNYSDDINDSESEEDDNEDEYEIEDIDDTSPISKLNDDCLLIVFSYFSLPQQLELFKVCKRWKRLLTSQWGRIKELNFSTTPLCDMDFNAKILAEYVAQCPNLTSLDLSKQSFKTNVLLSIVKNCRQLTKLSISGNELKHRSLALLAHHYPNLLSFSFAIPEDMFPSETNFDYEILQFIKKSKSLEELTIRYNSMCSEAGMWLPYLKPPLRSLHLEGLPFEFEHMQQGISSTKPTLREITLTGCSITLTGNLVNLIVKELPQLTRLTLTSMFGGANGELFPLANLNQLTHLSLEINNVSDELLQRLSENCPDLHTLELIASEENGVSENGVKFLPKFSKLHHLNLSGNTTITDGALHIIANKCPSLSYLSLQSCSISDVGCISIVTQLNSLEFLDIRNCDLVTNATVIAAIDAYRGGNKKKMVIAAGHTEIDFNLNWDTPGVKVDNCTSLSGSLSSIMGFEVYNDFHEHGIAPWFYSDPSDDDDDIDDDLDDDCYDLYSITSSDPESCMFDIVW